MVVAVTAVADIDGSRGICGDNGGGVDVDCGGVETKGGVSWSGEGLVVVGKEKLDGSERVDGAGVVNLVVKPLLKSRVDDESGELMNEGKSSL